LKRLHKLTKAGNAKLRIDIEAFKIPRARRGQPKRTSPKAFAEYDQFVVGDAADEYELLRISGYDGL